MITNVSKKNLMLYKAILNNEIAFSDEMIELGHLEFLKIKDNCRRYEKKRDYRKRDQVHASTFKHGNFYYSRDVINLNHFEDTLKSNSFKDYSIIMKQVARSILQYNSEDFISYLIYNSISYNDIKSLLEIVNKIKNNIRISPDDIDNASNLLLLNENIDLINMFFSFSAKCKTYFGYSNFKTVINKIEQLYMFENKELKQSLENQDNYQNKKK